MSQNQFIAIILGVILAAGLTIWALTSLGVPPVYILIGAMVGSVAVRFWSKRP